MVPGSWIAWADQDLTRGKVNKLLRETQMSAPFLRVNKPFVDAMVQHAMGTSARTDRFPRPLAGNRRIFGGAEWKDRRLDIAAEAERMLNALDPAERTPEAIEAGFRRGMEWMSKDEIFGTWFEDGPNVQKTLANLPRTDHVGMTALVMTEILPEKRAAWAERFLMMAMWCQAASEAKQRNKVRDLVLVAHALTTDEPLGAIPVMSMIALQTVRATLLGAW